MSKIYIACPAQTATGGPELLHQLCYKLKKLGYNSYMYYYDRNGNENPINKRYEIYNVEYTDRIEDDKKNIIIVPEVNVNLLKKFKKIKKTIWWLSVDNYFESKKSIRKKIITLFGILDFNYRDRDVIHLAQSQYAIEFLKESGINKEKIYYLSDYLNKIFLENSKNNDKNKKLDYILYNPKKGYEFTKKIIDNSRHLQWVPLENLTYDEMSNLLMQSKIYIDFGNHPGKDRIPREAAISGCCIITGKRGSARFKEDVFIEEEYKFEDKDDNIGIIVEKIEYMLKNYESESINFKEYRERILKEEEKFEEDINIIFSKII